MSDEIYSFLGNSYAYRNSHRGFEKHEPLSGRFRAVTVGNVEHIVTCCSRTESNSP